MWRDDHALDAENLGKAARVKRTAATERDERARAGIDAALDTHPTQRTGHRGVGRRDDRTRDTSLGLIELRRERTNAFLRRVRVQRDAAAHQAVGDATQRDMGVRHRRLRAAAIERHGARHRAGAVGTHLERATVVDPRDASAARRHRLDQNARHGDGHVRDAAPRLDQGLAVENEPDVGARASDVDGQRAIDLELPGDGRGAHDAARRTRKRELHGTARCLLDGSHSAARRHHADRTRPVGRPARQSILQVFQIARHTRPQICLRHRRRRPLVLANLRKHVGRDDDIHVLHAALNLLAQLPLVRRIPIGVQQQDGDDVRLERGDPLGGLARGILRQWPGDSLWLDALGHGHRELVRCERRRVVLGQVVQRAAILPPEVQEVREALGHTERDASALAFQEHVGRDGRSMHEPVDVGLIERTQRLDHALALVRRRAQHFPGVHAPAVVDRYEIGVSPPDVNADPEWHGPPEGVNRVGGRSRWRCSAEGAERRARDCPA